MITDPARLLGPARHLNIPVTVIQFANGNRREEYGHHRTPTEPGVASFTHTDFYTLQARPGVLAYPVPLYHVLPEHSRLVQDGSTRCTGSMAAS